MNKFFRALKKELLFIVILKSILVYSITLLSLNELIFFNTQNGILNLFVLIIIPLATLRTMKNKGIKFSLKHFILAGILISISSTMIRVFMLNKILTEIIYNDIFSNDKIQAIDLMTTWERIEESLKFISIGILFFVLIGSIIKLKKR